MGEAQEAAFADRKWTSRSLRLFWTNYYAGIAAKGYYADLCILTR
jgi:hypothetical protein